jgi:hypothetical protein
MMTHECSLHERRKQEEEREGKENTACGFNKSGTTFATRGRPHHDCDGEAGDDVALKVVAAVALAVAVQVEFECNTKARKLL